MLYEDLRFVHEDIERLEQAVADRVLDDPKHVSTSSLRPLCRDMTYNLQIRNRLVRDHEIANVLSLIQKQSQQALHIYNDQREAQTHEAQAISTGDPFEEFYKQLDNIKEHHKRYPNEPVENLERAYRKVKDGGPRFASDIDGMFTGEEGFGRFFDLTMLHEEYLNLPGIKSIRRLTYLQYLDIFDAFTPPQCTLSREDKMTDAYFSYVGSLAQYLESFMRRVKPLEDVDKTFALFNEAFEQLWSKDEVPGWEPALSTAKGNVATGPATQGTGEGLWCADCEKEFKNDNVYKAHLTGKKHIKNAELREKRRGEGDRESGNGVVTNGGVTPGVPLHRLKERAIAEREFRIVKLASTLQTQRDDTRVNVERKAGMTDRERQQELAAMYEEDMAMTYNAKQGDEEEEVDGDEKVYNPLKLPLAWDGKPIPFWLYKLHGLGVEFHCEICGNYVYMGRRAFDKHFSESRHIYGLKCLGITNTSLFREITQIEEATKLWDKIQRDKAQIEEKSIGVEQMEDETGHVMPKKVYDDLVRAGIIQA
nr:pre-mrna-splicing factor sap61 [Quercus suber]